MAKLISYFKLTIIGVGYWVVSQPSITTVTLVFTEKRSLATELALFGNGIGVFRMSPVTERFLPYYSWSGSFLKQTGIFLNGITCGFIYRPI